MPPLGVEKRAVGLASDDQGCTPTKLLELGRASAPGARVGLCIRASGWLMEADFCFLSPSTQVVHLLSNTLDSSSGDNPFKM